MSVPRWFAGFPLLALFLAGACNAAVSPSATSQASGSSAALPSLARQAPSGSPTASSPKRYALATLKPVSRNSSVATACAGIGLVDAVLQGAPSDPTHLWLSTGTYGARIPLFWPPGYKSIFNPMLEVLDPSGNVVLREGDQILGACVTSDGSALLLQPPFEVASPSPSPD